jgi:formylglycine-generating enzyme required for sulfatase activity
VWVDTDALVPEAGVAATGPVFDTLRIDVYSSDGTMQPGVSRTFLLGAQQFRDKVVSFGVHPPVGASGRVLRLRMFPSFASTKGNVPGSTAVIDVLAAIPEVAETGILERHISLHVDDVGTTLGTFDMPVALDPGRILDSQVNTWAGAATVPCQTTAIISSEACIPGGAFWMGNRRLVDNGAGTGSDQLRLVLLSPFFIDQTEVIVSEFRLSGLSATPGSGGDGTLFTDYCTLGSDPASDSLPINCVAWSDASQYCKKRGAQLPSEAQLEYVAGGFHGSLFVWGDDEPECGDAGIELGGNGFYRFFANDCDNSSKGGVVRVGTQKRDQIGWGDRHTVFDLVGNVREWALDVWNRQTEPCWTAGGVFVDPVCTTASLMDPVAHSTRGGGFPDAPRLAAAAARNYSTDKVPPIGFRCSRPDL